MDKINICVACDDNYAQYAGVLIASILDNAKEEDSLAVYILDGGISNEKKSEILTLKNIKDCEINFVNVDNSLFESYKKVITHSYVTLATYYRLKLASMLPDIDKIIYFDCDMVVNSSLAELFNTNLENYYIAGVRDINKRMLKQNPQYINAGLVVFNLDNIRKNDVESLFLNWTAENVDSIKMGDQTILNEVCKGKIKIVGDEWNVQSSNFTNRSSYTNSPKVIHFVARKKPWHYASYSYHRPLYFKYLQLTPWKLNDKDLEHWTKDNQRDSLIEYFKYRPMFMLRPRFYKALFYTYIYPFFQNN
ncbi:glycosyltransferase family 8 protein [bacterium]|nr:glycosyltransferase family 8 protein [bacterium]